MLKLADIVRGTVTRFVPGAVVGQAVMIGLLLIGEPTGLAWGDVPVLAAFTSLLAAGNLAALGALRKSMRSDAEVSGRRALITGLAAGAFHFGIAAAVDTLTVNEGLALAVLSGGVAAISMFFPWMSAHDSSTTDGQLNTSFEDVEALPAGADLDWTLERKEQDTERMRRS